MTKHEALKALADVLHEITDGLFGKPVIQSQSEGWNAPTLCWNGPFEWTMITAGSSLYAGELGNYSKPAEAKIAEALSKIEKAGYFLEPYDGGSLSIYNG